MAHLFEELLGHLSLDELRALAGHPSLFFGTAWWVYFQFFCIELQNGRSKAILVFYRDGHPTVCLKKCLLYKC